jgi:hypothetical protein
MIDVEAILASYRPDQNPTLFVGETAPASGEFFYFVAITQCCGICSAPQKQRWVKRGSPC